MSRVIRYASAFAIGGSVFAAPAVAGREQSFSISVPAGDLTDALATLAAQTGASVGVDVSLRGVRSAGASGRLTVAEALRRMLRGTRVTIVRVGPETFRIVAGHRGDTADDSPSPDVASAEVVVTARKYSELLSRVAAPMSVYRPSGHSIDRTEPSVAGVREVANAVEGLSVTNLGAGRDRPFIRGVADSAFNGFGQTTVSVNVDEARVTYDAPEPGLRLVDVARVEVLKGPQGPLYGTGALGGVYRLVTNKPVIGAASLSWATGYTLVGNGSVGADAEAVANIPLLKDHAALRLVGYASLDPGWIDNASGRRNVNTGWTRGTRAALRVAPANGWTVDVAGVLQRVGLDDSQYVDRDKEDLTRDLKAAEPSASVFKLVHGAVTGPIGSLRLTIATSYARQDRAERFDTSASAALAPLGAQSYHDVRRHEVFDQEVRVGSDLGQSLRWTAGVSYVSATTRATGDLTLANGTTSRYFVLHRVASELAAFADASIAVAPKLRIELGVRAFLAESTDERREELFPNAAAARKVFGVTPSAAVTYELTPDRLLFARVGTAYRPGGLDPENTETGRYEADSIRSIDVGARTMLDRGRLALEVGAFHSAWSDVQSDYLEPDGLIATRNAGDAKIIGGEVSATWQRGLWRLAVGASYQHGRLNSGDHNLDLPEDARLPVVPDVTARWEIAREVHRGPVTGRLYLGGNYSGSARLSFDQGLDRKMGGFASFRGGAVFALGKLDLRLEAENLLDARGDTFAFGNPFSIRTIRQYTPLRPRSLRIGIARRF